MVEGCIFSAVFLFHAPKCPFVPVLSHFSGAFGQNGAQFAVFSSFMHHGIMKPLDLREKTASQRSFSESGASYSKKCDYLHPNGVIGCIF